MRRDFLPTQVAEDWRAVKSWQDKATFSVDFSLKVNRNLPIFLSVDLQRARKDWPAGHTISKKITRMEDVEISEMERGFPGSQLDDQGGPFLCSPLALLLAISYNNPFFNLFLNICIFLNSGPHMMIQTVESLHHPKNGFYIDLLTYFWKIVKHSI